MSGHRQAMDIKSLRGMWPTRSNGRRSRGFTLLEIIISLSLFSILMALLWSLFHTYSRLSLRSQDAAKEFQIVRSVSRQLRSDIDHFAHQAIPFDVVPPSADESLADVPPTSDRPEHSGIPVTEADLLVTTEAGRTGIEPYGVVTTALPEVTFLRGSATRLELVTRHPYTVDIPQPRELIGDETRPGVYQLVVYEFHHAKELKLLLSEDPILNPRHQQEQNTPVLQGLPHQPPHHPQPPQRLNPNDNVGFTREAKSWLQHSREQQEAALHQQMVANPELLERRQPPDGGRDLLEQLRQKTSPSAGHASEHAAVATWSPPDPPRHRRDHLPEITRLQFRYFDGQQWQLEWNADQESLPRAIEIAFDVDPDAPAARAKEFETAHARMMQGAALNDVLPQEERNVPATFEEDQAPLQTLHLDDPTAIVTEYRFVIAVPHHAAVHEESSSRVEVSAEEGEG